MRYSMIILLLAGLLSSCDKEISPKQAEKFVKFYGSYLMDEASELEVLSNGGYAICGTINNSGSGRRMALILTDANGNVLSGFPKYYTEDGLETGASSMVVLNGESGGYLISGFVERPVAGSQAVQKDIFLIGASSSGEVVWQRSYGSAEDEQITHSIERIDSGFLLAGSQVKNGRSNIMVMGITEKGDSIRLGLNYNNPYNEKATANFLLNTGRDYLCLCSVENTNDAGIDMIVLSFDNELSPLKMNLSGELDEFGSCIVRETANHYLVLGNQINASGNMEMTIHSLGKDGIFITHSELLATIAEKNADLIGKGMTSTADGRYAIVGTRSVGNNSQMILQFISSGVIEAEQLSYGASGIQTGVDIQVGKDGGMVLLGTNSLGTNGVIFMIKTSETGAL